MDLLFFSNSRSRYVALSSSVVHWRYGIDHAIGLLQRVRLSDGISMAPFRTQAYHAGRVGLQC